MRKIYEADEDKRGIIEADNDLLSWNRVHKSRDEIGINDFVLIGSIDKEKLSRKIDIKWSLNALLPEKFKIEDITIIEPLVEHYDETLESINEACTRFNSKIELSKDAILFMSVNLYDELIKDRKY